MFALHDSPECAQRMRRAGFVVAIGDEKNDRRRSEPLHEIRQERDRRLSRPMQIFEHDEQRSYAREPFETAPHRLEKTRLLALGFER